MAKPVRRDRFGRPFDMQKSRVYDNEYFSQRSPAAVRFLGPTGKKYSTGSVHIDACQQYVDHLTSSAWFKRRWPRWSRTGIDVRFKAGGSALGYTSGRIMLPVFARNEQTILHEVAHVLTPSKYAVHGPEFAGIYLELVKYRVGKDVAALVRGKFQSAKDRGGRVRFQSAAWLKANGLMQ